MSDFDIDFESSDDSVDIDDIGGDEDTEDVDYDSDDDYDDDEYEEEEDDDEDDPWQWAKDEDPKNIEKTWKQYTQTREEVLRERAEAQSMRQELEPFVKLRDEIMADPGLVEVIDNYYANSRPVDRELADVKNEMMGLKSQIMTERELADVHGWASEQGYPEVDDSDILRHAIENGIANLKSAYKDLMFEELQEFKAQKLTKDIRRSKGAKATKTAKPQGGKRGVSTKDIYSMSDDDFIKNYESVLSRYSK
jgi:hypothetical protein